MRTLPEGCNRPLLDNPKFSRGSTTTAAWNDVIVGIALILLSLPRGLVQERYGSFQRYIR